MRSMVEREARASAVDARHHLAQPFNSSVSLSTTLRVVPLSQAGEA